MKVGVPVGELIRRQRGPRPRVEDEALPAARARGKQVVVALVYEEAGYRPACDTGHKDSARAGAQVAAIDRAVG